MFLFSHKGFTISKVEILNRDISPGTQILSRNSLFLFLFCCLQYPYSTMIQWFDLIGIKPYREGTVSDMRISNSLFDV